MSRVLPLAAAAALLGGPALAQPMDHAGHEGHAMHAPPPPAADAPAPETSPPAVVSDHAADHLFPPSEMERARQVLAEEHGGGRVWGVMLNLAEFQASTVGGDGYRWNVEAFYGGDLNRFVVKSEGEGGVHDGLESAELQGLYSRAVGPYTDLQIGIRQDFEPRPRRTYATVGVESLLPFWVEAQVALFLSDHGELLARAEGSYDLRLAQRLVLQPRAELEFAAQDVPEIRVGSGLTKAELGLRLRYEIRREFAPYIGVTYDRSSGRTADFLRAAGEPTERTSFVVGLGAWF